MLRTALRPRWLALFALVVAVVLGFGRLGLWQLDVARDDAREEARARIAAAPVVPVQQVLAPHTPLSGDAVGRTIEARGRFVPAEQVLVSPRRLQGASGSWVLTPLVVDATGARLPVIRGFVPDGTAPAAPPPGEVTVTGMLSPPESAPNDPRPQPSGHVQTVDLADLVNVWPGDVYSAMVFTTETRPAAADPALRPIPPPDLYATEFAWRNLAYALQWWIFAAFAVYMWWRMVRDDHETRRLLQREPGRADGSPPDGPIPGAPEHGAPISGAPEPTAHPTTEGADRR